MERRQVFHSAASATAVGPVMLTSNQPAVLVQVSGTFSASIAFEATVDGSNWVGILAENMNTGASALVATAAGLYLVPAGGVKGLRCNLTWTSGTSITVVGSGADRVVSPIDAL